MSTDFDGACTGIRIRPHGDGFRQILLRMVVIMDVHAEAPLMDLFPEGKHGFLGAAADKDLGILADGNIGPIVDRTDVVSNGLGPFVHNILIRGPADARRAPQRQGSGGDGHGDDAGQGWGAVID